MAVTDVEPDFIPVTVTFLDMHAPPSHYPPLPYGRQVALLRSRRPPLHFYRYLLDRVGRKWHWVNGLRLPDDELADKIQGPNADVRVLYLDGSPVGFFHLTREPAEDSIELTYFGMMAEAMGQGIGRWFLGAAIEAAWSYKPASINVQTCTLDHPAALPLYQKLGFSPFAQQQEMVRRMSMEERSEIVMRI